MDISSPKKNNPAYRNGDGKTRGVVDLRRFAESKKDPVSAEGGRGVLFYEIKPASGRIAKKYKNTENRIADMEKIVREDFSLKEEALLEEENIEDVSEESDNGEQEGEADYTFPRKRFKLFKRRTKIMPQLERPDFYHKKATLRFAVSSFMIPVVIFTFSFAQSQFERKGIVLGESTTAYDNLKSAAQTALASDFNATSRNFDEAQLNFAKAQETINGLGNGVGETIGSLPISTPISTAQSLAAAGEEISLSGKDMSAMMEKIAAKISENGGDKLSLSALTGLQDNMSSIAAHLKNANENMRKVDLQYIPGNMRDKIEIAKGTLPAIADDFQKLSEDYPSIIKMLGSERPQKYLLLFENNTEMRATGGFIGSYGILDLENGQIKSLAIDGIFNPDGQLQEKIVPPMPIQKISAAWSMHDSNWFADFPTSAKKTALFYEKTGGQTVDGVIAITPETIKKLLEITGPIEMPQYGVTITPNNFVAQTQSQVEDLYDKKENKPKKILSDLAPMLLDRLFKDGSISQDQKISRLLGAVQKIEESLREKHILMYHRDADIENMIQKRGWGGEIMQNQKGDYLAVINSNVNGYKTDAVIDEDIKLETEIKDDGSVIDTLTVRRKHNGGNDQYDWYNRVNADYMRVYVPKGSILLEAKGNTVEDYTPPIDYKDFKTDTDVAAVESTIKIDPDSKTQVFEEAGKTVFGNWVYVSPQEEVIVTYKYQLPFKINFEDYAKSVDAYSAIIQKQPGSAGDDFSATIKFPQGWNIPWQTKNLENKQELGEKLTRDLLYAEIFSRQQ